MVLLSRGFTYLFANTSFGINLESIRVGLEMVLTTRKVKGSVWVLFSSISMTCSVWLHDLDNPIALILLATVPTRVTSRNWGPFSCSQVP